MSAGSPSSEVPIGVHFEADLVLGLEMPGYLGEQIADRGAFTADRQNCDVCGGHAPMVAGPESRQTRAGADARGGRPQAMIVRAPGSASRVISSKVPM